MPAFGRPTSAASASSLRRSSSSRSSPGRPGLGEPRRLARRRREAAVAAAAGAALGDDGTRAPGCARSAIRSPFVVEHLRADGDAQLDVVAGRAVLAGAARRARRVPARNASRPTGTQHEVAQVGIGDEHDVARRRPPSPPSGPPLGTCFSRRKLSAPSPPRPAATRMRARSWNTRLARVTETERRSPLVRNSTLPSRIAKIVSSRPRPAPGPGGTRAALADDDHPGLHVLAGEDLHAEHLRVRVAPVPRRAESFLVCHYSSSSFLAAAGFARGRLLRRRLGFSAASGFSAVSAAGFLRRRGAALPTFWISISDSLLRCPCAAVTRLRLVLADPDLVAEHVRHDLRRHLRALRRELRLAVAAEESTAGWNGLPSA